MSEGAGVRTIEVAERATPELMQALQHLLPQLSGSAPSLDLDGLGRVVEHQAVRVLVARGADGTIVGSLCLVIFPLPSGVRAWIEDVVVDESARGQGIGEAMNREALRIAQEAGARTVDLTSRPSREEANRLYRRIGFGLRQTNVYRFEV